MSTEQSEGETQTQTNAGQYHIASDNSNRNYLARKKPKCVAAGKLVAERMKLA